VDSPNDPRPILLYHNGADCGTRYFAHHPSKPREKKKEGFYFTTFLLPPPAKHQPLVTDPFFLQGLPFRVRQRVNPNQKMGVMKQE